LREQVGPVSLVAPPGYGKSTLLASWAAEEERRFAWLSLDPRDDDPVVLWSAIVGAVRELEPGFGADVAAALRTPGADLTTGPIPRLLNEVEGAAPFVFILDDYHWISDPTCLRTIEFLFERAPASLTLVLSSRSDPMLPLARMRAAGGLLELGAGDLSFRLDETTRFLNDTLGLGLSDSALQALQARTEGWPAGLYLAYLSLRDSDDREGFVRAFRGSSRHVADYLSEVVLDSLDDRTRDFLISTSILERLSGPLADAVTQRNDSTSFLRELERTNHFLIPLDDRREWYRYHRLFADLLGDALQRRAPGAASELHRRAYGWFAQAADHDAAIRHAILAGDLEEATVLVCEHYIPTIEWGGFSTVARWLRLFPRDWVERDARMLVVEAWVMSFLNRREEAEAALEHAASIDYEGPLPDGASSLAASVVLVRAGFPWDDVSAMVAAAERAFLLEGRSGSPWTVTVHAQLGWARCLSGMFEEARPLLEHAAASAPASQQWLNAFGAHCSLAWVELEAGRLQEAERHAREAIAVVEANNLHQTPPAGWGYAMLGAVLGRMGRSRQADELLSRGIEQLRHGGQPLLVVQALLEQALVRRSIGAHSDARALTAEARAMLRGFKDAGALSERAQTVSHSVVRSPAGSATRDLTQRELDVLKLLEKGLPKREIADALFLSYNTIHSHAKSIYRKLDASNREEAIFHARERGLI
jgi:LuxR family transcriptional regulator, maltose regulon positive regulatory protein